MKFSKKTILCLFFCVSASLRFAIPIGAQVRPVNDYGALGLAQLLRRLNTTASVMMIGAHPDDEDSALLAYLARGESARTAYLSLTRGDGGQNIIGPELFEALGVIRTEELLQARRLDGAEQYFTRAYDYGFSKTLAEAKSKWPEDVIKCDVVRAIRLFRPMVVISRFTGTPADGHGQHQYAGYITPIAVKAAADPQQCREAGEPWQVLKFYVEQGFGDNLPTPTLRINTGQYDPILGRSYFEIAMEGRSMHRSQGEGRLELHGDQFSGLNLVETQSQRADKEENIFDGLNTSIAAADDILGVSERPTYADLAQAAELAGNAWKRYGPSTQAETFALLTKLLTALRAAYGAQHRTEVGAFLVLEKYTECEAALRAAAGLQIDALADSETVVAGGSLFIAVRAYVPKDSKFKIKELVLGVPPGNVTKLEFPKENSTTGFRRETPTIGSYYKVSMPNDQAITQPYWLCSARNDDLFLWSIAAYDASPFEPELLSALVKVDVDGNEISFLQPVHFRLADPARGEIRREVNVVPALSVSMDRKLIIQSLNPTKSHDRQITMTITNNSTKPISGTASIKFDTNNSWGFEAPNNTFTLKNKGDKTNVNFIVTIPRGIKPGNYHIYGQVTANETIFDQTMNVVAYPHIQTHRYYTPANTNVEVLELKTTPAKIGYIMGSGDEVPEAIRQMGMDVTMLEEKDLASGDLSRFDTIVVGIRASETRADMMANKQRLLDYVNGGGNLIMQYQRGNFAQSGLAPFPIDTNDKQGTTAGSVARVVDENAPVKILEPSSPIFNSPNKITDEDFKGWVQERNAYNLVTFDPKYTPLLESHDAGEQENKGGLVIAKVGKGNWVYCSYSFFRQLPAGVPGAYRLFDNLLSLPKSQGSSSRP